MTDSERRASILWSVAGFTLLLLAAMTSCENGQRMDQIAVRQRELELRQLVIRDTQDEMKAMITRFREKQLIIGGMVETVERRQVRNGQLIEAIAKALGIEESVKP